MEFEKTIQKYLEQRAKEDSLFAVSFAKPNKSIKECCTYILGEARKRGNAVAISDEEVYGMAVHYYDENNIKVAKMPANVKVSSSSVSKPVELTKEDKEKAREAAIQRLAEEQHALLKKKPTKAKKVDSEVQQMSLF
ncbi:PcfK-like family protein [Bacteroides sp.]|uniref:PcfK-like family protein n=1 Tax=Bacteroides sp. TaxID=29523 RepID=UPI002FC68B96